MFCFAADLAGASTVSSFIAELLVISAVALGCKYLRIPYTIALVAVGLGVGLGRSYFELKVQLTPELLFVVLLPALLFEAAIHLPLKVVMRNLKAILLLAVPGLLITAGVVGVALHYFLGLPLAAALVFGSLISATDPIAVLALFKQLKAPKDLAVVVEGESLLNDGAAVVLFNLLVAAAAGESISPLQGVGLFVLESAGGLLVGAALGWLVWRVHEKIDDHLIEITLSTILAYGSYLLAQRLHVSGVMAVISAGLIYGNFAMSRSMSDNTRLILGNTWDYLGFLCNSLVFLLIGTQVDLSLLLAQSGPVLLAFLVVCLGRALAVAILSPWTRLPWSWQPIVVWAGLRGSIAMALAMALNLPERQEILLLTFGVVLLSVFVQGLTIKPLLRRLGISAVKSPVLQEYEAHLAELLALEKALSVLRMRRSRHHLTADLYEELSGPLLQSIEELRSKVCAQGNHQDVRREQCQDAQIQMQIARRWGLREALQQDIIDEETYLSLRQKLGCDLTGR